MILAALCCFLVVINPMETAFCGSCDPSDAIETIPYLGNNNHNGFISRASVPDFLRFEESARHH